jgi:hypothetical protein
MNILKPECCFSLVGKGAMNPPRCWKQRGDVSRLRNETCANAAGFHHPYGAMIFNAAIPIGFQIANQKKSQRSKL